MLLSGFILDEDEVRIFSGVAITFCCVVVFLSSGKKSSSPEAKENCCFFLGLSVHVRAVVASCFPALRFGLLIIIALSLSEAKPGQLVSVTHNLASSPEFLKKSLL